MCLQFWSGARQHEPEHTDPTPPHFFFSARRALRATEPSRASNLPPAAQLSRLHPPTPTKQLRAIVCYRKSRWIWFDATPMAEKVKKSTGSSASGSRASPRRVVPLRFALSTALGASLCLQMLHSPAIPRHLAVIALNLTWRERAGALRRPWRSWKSGMTRGCEKKKGGPGPFFFCAQTGEALQRFGAARASAAPE